LGQRAFISYTKSIFVQKDKDIFKLRELDLEGFAASMGLPGAPKIKFQKGDDAKRLKNAPRGASSLSDGDSDAEDIGGKGRKKGEVRTKYDRMFERQNRDILSGHYSKMVANEDSDASDVLSENGDEEDFLSVKRVLQADDEHSSDMTERHPISSTVKVIHGIGKEPLVLDSKRREKLLQSKKQLIKFKEKGKKIVFDENGAPHEIYELGDEGTFHARGTAEAQRAKFLEEEAARAQLADQQDKVVAREKRQEKKLKRKLREAGKMNDIDDEEAPGLVGADDEEDPLALLKALPLEEDDEDGPPQKKPKKWFQDDAGDEQQESRRKNRIIEINEEPETLEDLEALASGLLS